jgi:NIMA (never in mitosis gene a)-related kinase
MKHYQTVRAIGRGSYGTVDLVRDLRTKALVVMKTITVGARGATTLETAQREATLLSKLRHPNIIRLLDSFVKSPTEFCLVLEYADGQDLSVYLAKHRKLSEQMILKFFSQIILGLAYLHSPEVRVLHRDLKTANIFLFSNGLLKLGDFGISKRLQNEDLAQTLIGTPFYVSPELLSQHRYGFPSDIWGAGCILYEMMTGERAFEGADRDSVFSRILREHVREPAGYSKELQRLVSDMLCKVPEKRPTADDILAMPLLEETLDALETGLGEGLEERRQNGEESPEWIKDTEAVEEELFRQSQNQQKEDAAALVTVLRASVSRRVAEEVVSAGGIESDLFGRKRKLEAKARRLLGDEKYGIAYRFVKENYCENREELAKLLKEEKVPPAVKLIEAITMIERYE